MKLTKEEYLLYRQRAQELYGRKDASGEISIPRDSSVMPTEDGAFVQAVVWVPKEKLLPPQLAAAEVNSVESVPDDDILF